MVPLIQQLYTHTVFLHIWPVVTKKKRNREPSGVTYLRQVGVGVESALVASLAAALRAGVEVGLAVAHQVGGFADGAQLAAGHGCDLWHGVGGRGDAAVRGGGGGPPRPAASYVHLQILPGRVAAGALLCLGRSVLVSVVGG